LAYIVKAILKATLKKELRHFIEKFLEAEPVQKRRDAPPIFGECHLSVL
jgi:hypothetical protein